MLNSKYDCVIWGKSYLSVIFALSQIIKKNKSVLIIDDSDAQMGELWCSNIGEVEKYSLSRIGAQIDIQPLQKIDNYIRPLSTIVQLNEKMIELGQSPYANIRELSRKLPECFPLSMLKTIEKYGEQKFNEDFFKFCSDMSENIFIEGSKNFKTTSSSIKIIFEVFLSFIKSSSEASEQFYYTLQALYQTFHSNLKEENSLCYLLCSVLSPRYELDSSALLNDLLFDFKSLGGDVTESSVEEYNVYKNEMKFLKLASLDGIIEFNSLNIFSRLERKMPFKHKRDHLCFDSIVLNSRVEHEIIKFYEDKRIIVCEKDRLGTDFPHFEYQILSSGHIKGVYSYANELGTKPNFYYKKVVEEIFASLNNLLPGINKEKFISEASFKPGDDFWNRLPSSFKREFSKKASYNDLYTADTESKIHNLNYFGPFRTQSLGLYSYLWDLA